MTTNVSIKMISKPLLDRLDQKATDEGVSRSRLIENILAEHFRLKRSVYKPYFATVSREECQAANVLATKARMKNKELNGASGGDA